MTCTLLLPALSSLSLLPLFFRCRTADYSRVFPSDVRYTAARVCTCKVRSNFVARSLLPRFFARTPANPDISISPRP